MSRTKRGSKGPGYEYWAGRLEPHGDIPGRYTKRRTAKKERRRDKKLAYKALKCSGED